MEEEPISDSEMLLCDIMRTTEDFGSLDMFLPDLSSFDVSPDLENMLSEEEEEEPKTSDSCRNFVEVEGEEPEMTGRTINRIQNTKIKVPDHEMEENLTYSAKLISKLLCEKGEEPEATGSEVNQTQNTKIKALICDKEEEFAATGSENNQTKHGKKEPIYVSKFIPKVIYDWGEEPVTTGSYSNQIQNTKIKVLQQEEEEKPYSAKLIRKVKYERREGPLTTGSEDNQTQKTKIKALISKEELLPKKNPTYEKEEEPVAARSFETEKTKVQPSESKGEEPKTRASNNVAAAGSFDFSVRLTELSFDIMRTIEDFGKFEMRLPDLAGFDSSPDVYLGNRIKKDRNEGEEPRGSDTRSHGVPTGGERNQTNAANIKAPTHVREMELEPTGSERNQTKTANIKAPKRGEETKPMCAFKFIPKAMYELFEETGGESNQTRNTNIKPVKCEGGACGDRK
ncbi:hypothetical protein JOB18_026394 [Solea senegalensis]|uniref:Uncharacterized protein n=1 Tax=Solea senegalensis TaxID=28829 RepID=A0AAV6S660_SOLSE|nr:hypothetical protein JOB18_026394 [Solea senegalensis]